MGNVFLLSIQLWAIFLLSLKNGASSLAQQAEADLFAFPRPPLAEHLYTGASCPRAAICLQLSFTTLTLSLCRTAEHPPPLSCGSCASRRRAGPQLGVDFQSQPKWFYPLANPNGNL
jgi:hypothetical protein